jgi:hypothetical protein
MALYMEDKYARLRGYLRVDQAELGEELIQFPQLLMEVLEVIAALSAVKESLEGQYKNAVAISAGDLRSYPGPNDRKRPEAEIAAEAPLTPLSQDAYAKVAEARESMAFWSSLAEAFRAKQSSLKRLSDLTVSGYIATGSAYVPQNRNNQYENMREEMADKRRAATDAATGVPRRRPSS